MGKLIEAFHDDATIEQACYYSGIDKTTYYDWLKQDQAFSYEMQKAQEYPKVLAKRVLVKAMENGDEKIALEVIKRREKERYSDRSEFTGKDGESLFGWQDDNNTVQPNASPEGDTRQPE